MVWSAAAVVVMAVCAARVSAVEDDGAEGSDADSLSSRTHVCTANKCQLNYRLPPDVGTLNLIEDSCYWFENGTSRCCCDQRCRDDAYGDCCEGFATTCTDAPGSEPPTELKPFQTSGRKGCTGTRSSFLRTRTDCHERAARESFLLILNLTRAAHVT